MCESALYRNLIEFPTDFVSREAIKASVCESAILPPPRFIKYPIRGAGLWGVHGGIEKLPMLARTPPSTKIPGIISEVHESKHQPCVLTSITIPGKKADDESDLLPLIERNIESARLPECLRPHLFTSHVSKFEVFPRFDPVYSEYDASSRRTVKQEISPTTQFALDKLSEVLYRKSIYKTDFQPLVPRQDVSYGLPGVYQETSAQRGLGVVSKVVLEATSRKEVSTDKAKERKEKGGLDEGVDEEEEETEGEKEGKSEALDLDKGRANDQSNDWDSLKEDAKKARAKWLYCKRNASTVLPTRSPYQNTEGDQTGFSTLTLPEHLYGISPSPRQRSLLFSSTKAMQKVALGKVGEVGANMRLPFVPGRFSHARGKEAVREVGETRGAEMNVRLPSLGAMIGDLTQYRRGNYQRKNKLPLLVGARFKTDAHIKFHKEHPEAVPDLRDSITDGKKHVFFGTHGMLLR